MAGNDYLDGEIKAIRLAIDNEKKVRAFYLDHAKAIKNPLAKKTFIFLADEELKHIDSINEFVKSIKEGDVPMIDAGPEDEALDRSQEFFSIGVKEYGLRAKASEKDIHVYGLGLDMELKGYNFYKKAAGEARHPNVKKLFEFLSKEEDAHYHLLMNALHYFKNPSGYFQDEEGWMFEG